MDFHRLFYIRENKGLTQRQIAKLLGVSKSTYARWETCEQIIPMIHLNNFCKVLKVSMDYIFLFDNENHYNIYNYDTLLSKKNIGNNIKKMRKKFNLTQKDLAEILNTTQSTICAYESGKTLLLTSFAYTICKKFNLSLDKLCSRSKETNTIK